MVYKKWHESGKHSDISGDLFSKYLMLAQGQLHGTIENPAMLRLNSTQTEQCWNCATHAALLVQISKKTKRVYPVTLRLGPGEGVAALDQT